MENFREYIRGNAKPLTNPLDAMRAVLVGITAHEAMRDGSLAKTLPEIAPEIVEYFDSELE